MNVSLGCQHLPQNFHISWYYAGARETHLHTCWHRGGAQTGRKPPEQQRLSRSIKPPRRPRERKLLLNPQTAPDNKIGKDDDRIDKDDNNLQMGGIGRDDNNSEMDRDDNNLKMGGVDRDDNNIEMGGRMTAPTNA